jgi:hypothetical protein
MVPGTIDVFCQACAHMVRVNVKRAGTYSSCPACDANMFIPKPSPEAPKTLGQLRFASRRFPFFWQRVRVFEGGLELAGESILWREVVAIERTPRALHVFGRGRRTLVVKVQQAIEAIVSESSQYVTTRNVELAVA